MSFFQLDQTGVIHTEDPYSDFEPALWFEEPRQRPGRIQIGVQDSTDRRYAGLIEVDKAKLVTFLEKALEGLR